MKVYICTNTEEHPDKIGRVYTDLEYEKGEEIVCKVCKRKMERV